MFITIQQEHQSNWQNRQLGSPNSLFNDVYFQLLLDWRENIKVMKLSWLSISELQ